MRFLERYTEHAFFLLRAVAGLLFAFHGLQKIFGVLSEFQAAPGTQMWFGGIIEITAGLSIAIGIFAQCAAFIASGMMAVAYTQFHWKLALGANFFPGVNKGEMALVYCVLFFYLACRGPGPWSLDSLRWARKRQ
jgi:putative oxidoreductase